MHRHYAALAVLADSRPLVIVDRCPLPAVTGGRQRMWNFLLAIGDIGPADLIVLESYDERQERTILEALPAWTTRFVPVPRRRLTTVGRMAQVARGRDPSALGRLDLDGAARAVRSQLHAHDRSLVVAIQPIAAAVAQHLRLPSGRLVVDLWDVEDARLKRLHAIKPAGSRWKPRSVWETVRDGADRRAWRRFNSGLVGCADIVTVCSSVDQRAMPASERVHVVPNGADVHPLTSRSPHDPPVLLFHGQLTYAPNADAAGILAGQILPAVRTTLPEVRVRLVGRADERVLRLADPPAVTVTGFVDDIDEELTNADLLVVPLRVGGGTRLKILEAFAHGLPVVSTRIGAEGLDVEHGVHLMIADDPTDIATIAAELLRDHAATERMTEAARALVEQRYDWSAIRADLRQLLRSAMEPSETDVRGTPPVP